MSFQPGLVKLTIYLHSLESEFLQKVMMQLYCRESPLTKPVHRHAVGTYTKKLYNENKTVNFFYYFI